MVNREAQVLEKGFREANGKDATKLFLGIRRAVLRK